jgi:hypothetical protein
MLARFKAQVIANVRFGQQGYRIWCSGPKVESEGRNGECDKNDCEIFKTFQKADHFRPTCPVVVNTPQSRSSVGGRSHCAGLRRCRRGSRLRKGVFFLWLNHCIVGVDNMNFVKTFLAVLLGFLLGATLCRPRPAKAAGNVYVKQVPVGVYNPIQGSNVVGFSCTGSGANAACYIASQ